MKKDEIITFLQQLVESQKLQLESQNRQIDRPYRTSRLAYWRGGKSLGASGPKGKEEEKTKRRELRRIHIGRD